MNAIFSNRNLKTWRTFAVAAAIAGAASVAAAQVAPNYSQNGRLLDKNPQVGGGGSNAPVAGYVPATGNEVITGNVTGLGYFHGNVPYRSQYEFGSVGNSSVNNFNRQSGGVPANGNYTGQATSFYTPSLVVATPNGISASELRSSSAGSGVEANMARSNASRLNVDAVGSQVQLQPGGLLTSQPQRDYLSNPDPANNSFSPDGRVSNLFGLTQRDPRAEAPQNQFQNLAPQKNPDGTPVKPGAIDNRVNPAGPATQQGQLGDDHIRTDLGVKNQINGNVNGQLATSQLDERLRGGAPSTLVGQTNHDLVVSEEYQDLLAKLQKSRDAEQARQEVAVTPVKPATGPEFVIDPVTGILRVRGIDENGAQPGTGAATRPGAVRTKDQMRDATAALRAAGSMPPLETLAGKSGTPFNQLMGDAEARLKAGKTFEAANLYKQAMEMQPANMLPVIGRAHAELAGGMYESAAYDLKFIFERKPEMIGLRHSLKTEIPADRLDFLASDLKDLADNKESESAWFLQSYLQYQLGQKVPLNTTLKTWAEKMPKDAWPSAMRKAWLDTAPDDGGTKPKTDPAPAEQGGAK